MASFLCEATPWKKNGDPFRYMLCGSDGMLVLSMDFSAFLKCLSFA